MNASRYIWRALEWLLLRRDNAPRLTVLIFHRVLDARDPLRPGEPDAAEFGALIQFLSINFLIKPLSVAIDDLASNMINRHSVAITFDDGYADNVELAMPILKQYRVPATFFVSSGAVESGTMWNDRVIDAIKYCETKTIDLREIGSEVFDIETLEGKRAAVRSAISMTKYCNADERRHHVDIVESEAGARCASVHMMSREQLSFLASHDLFDIGGHTVSHPILSAIPVEEARREIVEDKRELERVVGGDIDSFAYPNGIPGKDYNTEHVSMIAGAGYRIAVSTSSGGCSKSTDRLQIPRISPWDRNRQRFGTRMLLTTRENGKCVEA